MWAGRLATVAVALLLGFLLVAFRGEPIATSDQGVFLSVAARMLDGDQLYSEVVDNKDPLFFYSYAGALWAGGWRGPFALEGLWLALAAIAIALTLYELRAPRAAVVTGFFLYPLGLTAAWYQPGLSMLGALAIAPLAAWLWLRGQSIAAGAAVGVAILFKINLALVAGAPIAAFLLLGASDRGRLRQLGHGALGLLAVLGGAAAFLAGRGALTSYLDVLGYNVHYSGSLNAPGPLDGVRHHLEVLRGFFVAAGRWQAPAALAALGVFVVAAVLGWTRGGPPFRALAAAAAAALVAVLTTIALTALWNHHLQMLAYPAALGGAALVAAATIRFGNRLGVVAAATCILFAAWSSVKHEVAAGVSARAWSADAISVPADELEKARLRFHPSSAQVTYMVFGGNSENAHAVFVEDPFALSCRFFHLYPFSLEEQFAETLACGAREEPMLVLVTLGFFDDRAAEGSWGTFVRGARRFLDTRYEKVGQAYPGFQVWTRRGMAS